jgi:UDP-N-acetylglucosamine/UDP-N-acetylgalactosamine diphosphorylase
MSSRLERLRARFESEGQGHVLAFAHELDDTRRERLFDQLESIDLGLVKKLRELVRRPGERAHHAEFAPPEVFPLHRTGAQEKHAREAKQRGEELLRAGSVAFLLVAGGQASRLGFEGPKGAFPVGPVSGRSLFEVFARRLHAAHQRYGRPPTWYILTSDSNDAETREFFGEHAHFGLDPELVFFMRQGMIPALDRAGRIVLSARGKVFMAPNGHGGVLAALSSSGALEHARSRGVKCFSCFQVDNPLARPADPLFLGLHAEASARMSSKVVEKRSADEKVGVIGLVDGKLSCIEYSDLPEDLREARGPRGELVYRAGNIAMHVIDVAFVDELTRGAFKLPWHLAKKSMEVIDARGEKARIEGFKFETFVFDALELAGRSVTLEVDRRLEFSPVKNKTGVDSPATARADMCRLFAGWAASAGLSLPEPDESGLHPVEIDPCSGEDVEEFRARSPRSPAISSRGHFYA